MYTLGINAVFHDSAACLVKDGKVIAAAEEERFTHIKHGKRPVPFSSYELPFHAIAYCLREGGIHINDVDHIAYSFDPQQLLGEAYRDNSDILLPLRPGESEGNEQWLSPWDPLFIAYIFNAPRQLQDGWPLHLQKEFHLAERITEKWHFVDHHISHAASAFLASPFERAAVLTLDGRGEKATTVFYRGQQNELTELNRVEMPHSLGLLYEKITTYLGFLHSSDEYKVMALASYGQPLFADVFREMITVYDDGTYTIEDIDLVEAFGPSRLRHDPLTQHHFNIAHSLQVVLQETVLKLAEWLYRQTGERNLCLAGGVALNCVLNAYLRDHGPFENVWVQPAAGDAGTALGAALWVDARQRGSHSKDFVMDHAYWGPAFDDAAIERFLTWTKTPHTKMKDVARETAELLAADKIIGWFQGRMEFGPRALGSRSILASPIRAEMQARLNEVKDREDFRPVAPVVLEEDAADWFACEGPSPFMLFINRVRPDKQEAIPAVVHVDGTARIQTVNKDQHPQYYALLQAFKEITGVPVLVNTSFNTLGKPIVCNVRDALECFWGSPFDALIIGSYLIQKKRFDARENDQETRSRELQPLQETLLHETT